MSVLMKMILGLEKIMPRKTSAIIRHIALNLLKPEKTRKVGVKNKRKNAGWNEQYLIKVLTS